LSELRAEWKQLSSTNAVVYGVNPGSQASHAKFARKLALPFPLLIDPRGRVARRYRAWALLTKRTVYAISPDGVICFAQRGSPPPKDIAAAIAG